MPRGTWVPESEAHSSFVYRTLTCCGSTFQNDSTRGEGFVFRRAPHDPDIRSRNTDHATRTGLARDRFRLFPFRSPLLGKSQLLSVPRATEMFQFAPLTMDTYGFSAH